MSVGRLFGESLLNSPRSTQMTEFHRRTILGSIVASATVAALGLAITPDPAEAAPLSLAAGSVALTENPIEEAAVRRVCWWQNGRRLCRWRRVRKGCWWHRGYRICR